MANGTQKLNIIGAIVSTTPAPFHRFDLREAGLAMGATQWRTVASIVVPAARNGLLTATILGVARIAGETAPLIFTIGGSDKFKFEPFPRLSRSTSFLCMERSIARNSGIDPARLDRNLGPFDFSFNTFHFGKKFWF